METYQYNYKYSDLDDETSYHYAQTIYYLDILLKYYREIKVHNFYQGITSLDLGKNPDQIYLQLRKLKDRIFNIENFFPDQLDEFKRYFLTFSIFFRNQEFANYDPDIQFFYNRIFYHIERLLSLLM